MTDLEHSRLLARLFTRPVMDEIARYGSADKVVQQLKAIGIPGRRPSTVAEVFDAALAHIQAAYRCEYVYKAAIANRIVFGRHSPRTAGLAIELGVASSIVDAAVFNGTSTAYEIKTELDSHRRLPSQSTAYLRVFDRVYVVTHPTLAERYAAQVDPRVGILCLTEKETFREFRAPVGDVHRIDPQTVFRMLRRHEYMDIVHEHFGAQPELPNGRIAGHYGALFSRLLPAQAHKALVDSMRQRTTDEESVNFVSAVPVSLRALAFATPLSRPQRERVLGALAAAV